MRSPRPQGWDKEGQGRGPMLQLSTPWQLGIGTRAQQMCPKAENGEGEEAWRGEPTKSEEGNAGASVSHRCVALQSDPRLKTGRNRAKKAHTCPRTVHAEAVRPQIRDPGPSRTASAGVGIGHARRISSGLSTTTEHERATDCCLPHLRLGLLTTTRGCIGRTWHDFYHHPQSVWPTRARLKRSARPPRHCVAGVARVVAF